MDSPVFVKHACPALLLLSVLLLVGDRVCQNQPLARQWGKRVSLCSFVAWCVLQLHRDDLTDVEALLPSVIDALLVAGATLGVSWIVLPIAVFVVQRAVWPVGVALWNVARRTVGWVRQPFQRRRDRVRQNREEEQQRQEQRQQQQESRQQEASQARCAEARSEVDLCHGELAVALNKRFTRKMLDQYMATYLTDHDDPEIVERRAEQLIATLRRIAASTTEGTSRQGTLTLSDLTAQYQSQLEQIDALPISDEAKEMQRAALEARFAERTAELLEGR